MSEALTYPHPNLPAAAINRTDFNWQLQFHLLGLVDHWICQESPEAGKIGGWIQDPALELWRKRQQETAGLSQTENWKRTCLKSTCIPYPGMAASQNKPWGEILAAPGMRETGIRSGTRSIPESTWKTEPGSPGWKGKTRGCKGIPLFESLWGLDIRSKHLQDTGDLSKDTVQEFSKICSWVFRKPCLSSLPTLMGIPSSALRSWSRHGTIPKPGFGAPWHWPCHAPRIPLIPLPVDPHSPGSP